VNWAALTCIAIAISAACGFAYVKGRADGRAVERDKRAGELSIEARASAAAASAAADAISKIEIRHVTIRQALETQVREVPVFRDCHLPADSLRNLNAALTGAEPAAAAGSVPAASAPDR
jgi:hypothetical protein